MRGISYVYIIKMTQDELNDYVVKAKEAGLIYHPAHFVYSMKNTEGEVFEYKFRPLNENNGLSRDSIISRRSVGVVIVTPYVMEIPHKTYESVARKIKNILLDIGLTKPELVTDFKDTNKQINVSTMYNEIKQSDNDFVILNKGF